MKKLLILPLLLLVGAVQAAPSIEVCTATKNFAESIMENRQLGVPKELMFTVIPDSAYYILIESAYQQDSEVTFIGKHHQIKSFGATAFSACMRGDFK